MPKKISYPLLEGRAKEAADECISSRRLPNGLIIFARDRSDAEYAARYLATGTACTGEHRPCGECDACYKIFANISQDVVDVRPEDGRQGVNVDGIRSMRTNAYVIPGELDIKVYIIHDADRMNASAQNALLKVLEEPPSAVHFMLLCSNTAALLPTVRSRCWTMSVSGGKDKPRTGSKISGLVTKTVDAMTGNRRSDLEGLIAELPDDRNDYKEYVTGLLNAIRNICAARAKRTDGMNDDEKDFAQKTSRLISDAALMRAYDRVRSALLANDANVHVTTSQTALLSDLWTAVHN